jgi:hypothetical protein
MKYFKWSNLLGVRCSTCSFLYQRVLFQTLSPEVRLLRVSSQLPKLSRCKFTSSTMDFVHCVWCHIVAKMRGCLLDKVPSRSSILSFRPSLRRFVSYSQMIESHCSPAVGLRKHLQILWECQSERKCDKS